MNRVFYSALLVVILLSGCGVASVTYLPLHDAQGARYESLQELLIRGIKKQIPSAKHDYIKLFPKPGIGGPEVVNLGTLPSGAVFEVIGLVQQGPKFFGRRMYLVRVEGPLAERLKDEEVWLSSWDGFYVGMDEYDQPILNPDLFRRIREKRPNQPPEPTAMSVTPRADARVAPATTVAHL